jgi:hypothetical protein
VTRRTARVWPAGIADGEGVAGRRLSGAADVRHQRPQCQRDQNLAAAVTAPQPRAARRPAGPGDRVTTARPAVPAGRRRPVRPECQCRRDRDRRPGPGPDGRRSLCRCAAGPGVRIGRPMSRSLALALSRSRSLSLSLFRSRSLSLSLSLSFALARSIATPSGLTDVWSELLRALLAHERRPAARRGRVPPCSSSPHPVSLSRSLSPSHLHPHTHQDLLDVLRGEVASLPAAGRDTQCSWAGLLLACE